MFELKFGIENSAFSDGCAPSEIAAILRKVARDVERQYSDGEFFTNQIFDSNGNSIGRITICER